MFKSTGENTELLHVCDAHTLISESINESKFHKKSISFMPKYKFGRPNISDTAEDFEKSKNEVACQTESIEKKLKTTQTEEPAKIRKLAKDYARNGWTQKLVMPSKKEVRNKKFPIPRNEIMDKGFSIICGPPQKISDLPAPPAMSAAYLKKSIEEIDRRIIHTESDLRTLLESQKAERREITVIKKSLNEFDFGIAIFSELLLKKFQEADVNVLPNLKIQISNDIRTVERSKPESMLITSKTPTTSAGEFKVPAIPKAIKRKIAATPVDLPQLGARKHTCPTNIAKKRQKENNISQEQRPQPTADSNSTTEQQPHPTVDSNSTVEFEDIEKIKTNFERDAARVNALFERLRSEDLNTVNNVNKNIVNILNNEDVLDLDFEFDEGFFDM